MIRCFADTFAGEAGLAGAAEDAKDVVLGGREVIRFQQFLKAAHEEVAGTDDVEEKLLLNTIEGAGFMDFFN